MKNRMNKILSNMPNHWWGITMYTFGTFVILDLTKWIPLRFWGATSGEHFVDTKQILNSVRCLEENESTQSSDLCNGYVYGKTLLKGLDLLNLNSPQTTFLGFLFLGLLAVVFGLVSFKSLIPKSIYFGIVLSPPVLLLAERANFDILMVALVLFASLLSRQGRQIGSTLLLAVASLVKFYTIPLMFIQASYTRKPLIRSLIIGFSVVISYLIGKEILATKKLMNPTSGTGYNNGEGFGFHIWAGYLPRFKNFLPIDMGVAGYVASGAVLAILITGALIYLRFKEVGSTPTPILQGNSYRSFEYLLIVHLSCFFAGVSIDYRLIFIITATLSYLSAISPLKKQDTDRNLIIGLLVISLWCTYPSDGLQYIGDISLTVLTLLLAEKAIRQRILIRKHLKK
jgi:hypothetical protein